MILSIEQLAKRLAQGGGCDEHACTLETLRVRDIPEAPKQFHPDALVLRHIVQHGEDKGDRFHATLSADSERQMLDEDDNIGLTKRLHIMDHIRHEHKGDGPFACSVCADDAPGANPDMPDIAVVVNIVDLKSLSALADTMTKDDAIEMIKKLAAKDPEFGSKLREHFRG